MEAGVHGRLVVSVTSIQERKNTKDIVIILLPKMVVDHVEGRITKWSLVTLTVNGQIGMSGECVTWRMEASRREKGFATTHHSTTMEHHVWGLQMCSENAQTLVLCIHLGLMVAMILMTSATLKTAKLETFHKSL